MNKIKNTVITFVAAVALSACTSGMQLDQAKSVGPGGSAFNFNLYKGYVGLSQAEFDEGDYEDSDEFANRAMKASKNGKIKPEGFKKRKLPADKITELRRARGKLMVALAQGGRENYPNLAANAQVQFDCWMQEQEENFQPKDIEACKKGFMKAIAKLEKAVAPKPVAKKMMKKKMPMMAAKPRAPEPVDVDGIYIVFFDLNSSKLNPASQRILRKAAAEFALTDSPGMNLTGHTDKAGPAGYNYDLSQRRLNAVRGYLMKMGVTQPSLLSSAYGEEKPLVPTRDGKKEKRNRRVEIIFQ